MSGSPGSNVPPALRMRLPARPEGSLDAAAVV